MREQQTTTLLRDGRVLVAGGRGWDNKPLASAEIYDPVTGRWAATSPMVAARRAHTATLLPDGRVLVAGGTACRYLCGADGLDSAEIYDPVRGTWSPTGSLAVARSAHIATALADGTVLVAGGIGSDPGVASSQALDVPALQSAELYDSVTGTWRPTASMHLGRYESTSTALPDGRVFIGGGDASSGSNDESLARSRKTRRTGELYDPATGVWTLSEDAPLGDLNWTAALPGGMVLSLSGSHFDKAQVYNPMTGHWTAMSVVGSASQRSTLILLLDGTVLASGGYDEATSNDVATAATSLFNPSVGTWTPTMGMSTARVEHSAVMLSNGTVLVYGGTQLRYHWYSGPYPDTVYVVTSEVYTPTAGSWSPKGP